MKKLFIGILIGCGIGFAVSANAEEIQTVVGKVIQGEFPVKIGDKELTNKAIVVDGTSYLPVREFGEAIGYEVKFSADLGVTLSPKANPEEQARIEQTNELLKQADELMKQRDELNAIVGPYENIGFYNGKIGPEKEKDDAYYEARKKLDEVNAKLEENSKKLNTPPTP